MYGIGMTRRNFTNDIKSLPLTYFQNNCYIELKWKRFKVMIFATEYRTRFILAIDTRSDIKLNSRNVFCKKAKRKLN